MKKIISALMGVALLLGTLGGCGRKAGAEGAVYYLNFKPEQDAQWQTLAKRYTEKTGVEVKVLTAAEGQYEATLTSEMDKSNAPTLFQVNGPVGLESWKNYCMDLTGSAVYDELSRDDFALKADGEVLGVAYAVETYGIIYNKALLDRYFAADWSTVKRVEDINGFTALKTVATEIQAHKKDLGVRGAFTSAGMSASSDWRFKTHLANLPIYYEYKAEGITSSPAIQGTYLDGYKKIWDLYLQNATCAPGEIAGKTATDAQTEFKTGQAVFYQNGTWEYAGTKYDEATGEGLKDDQYGMLPIYIDAPGEADQGLCTGSENYWCVNKNASAADQKATLDFLAWLVTDEEGTKAMAQDMGFVIPFKKAQGSTNPLVKAADAYNDKTPVSWAFSTIPSDSWKSGVGTALTQYAAGTKDWSEVEKAFVEGWKTEYDKAHKTA